MPSKPFWFKSNKSQASVGGATDHGSPSALPEHRSIQPPDDTPHHSRYPPLHPSHRASASASAPDPARAPTAVPAAVNPADVTTAPPAYAINYACNPPPPERSVTAAPERKSLRSRLGLVSSSRDGPDPSFRDRNLSRRVSVRKKEVSDDQRSQHHYSWRQGQQQPLAPSCEVEEHNPYLLGQPELRSPVPPAKDPNYQPRPPPTIGRSPDHNPNFHSSSPTRVDSEQSAQQSPHARNSPQGHYLQEYPDPQKFQQQEHALQHSLLESLTLPSEQQFQTQSTAHSRPPVVRVPVPPQQRHIQDSVSLPNYHFAIATGQESYPKEPVDLMAPPPSKRSSDVPKSTAVAAPKEGSPLAQQTTNSRQAFGADVIPSGAQDQRFKGGRNAGGNGHESGRGTPPPKRAVCDMTNEEVAQLSKDHDELREKYQKVKRYFFEQQNQVHSLQNSLAHHRLSQSRTSLDDTEYTNRFERLHGLVKQAAFAIRKIWKRVPPWLHTAVNHDAVDLKPREMTAVGRAVISRWLVDEVFNKFFHPDLDRHLSEQLKSCHLNIRKAIPPAHSPVEEEMVISKLVNWRLATAEGFAQRLREPQASANREELSKDLAKCLIATMETYVSDPNHEDFLELKANVSPIIDLLIVIISNLPLESREIAVDYYLPGHGILGDQMTVESGIPSLVQPCAEGVLQHRDNDAAILSSIACDSKEFPGASAIEDESQLGSSQTHQQESKRPVGRSMLSSIIGGGGGGASSSGKKLHQNDARQQLGPTRAGDVGGSQISLHSGPPKEELPPRVRIATGLNVRVFGRGVLWKATVFSTA